MSQVALAPASPADAPELIRANVESRDLHRPWTEPFTDIEGFDRWWHQLTTGPNLGLVAREVASGEVVGVVTLSQIVRGLFQSAYLGFHGRTGFSGRGLMTEAVRLACADAFEELRLHRLEANIQPGNLRSLALVQRLGFKKEGFSPRYLRIGGAWRDHERWALLADEPPQ